MIEFGYKKEADQDRWSRLLLSAVREFGLKSWPFDQLSVDWVCTLIRLCKHNSPKPGLLESTVAKQLLHVAVHQL